MLTERLVGDLATLPVKLVDFDLAQATITTELFRTLSAVAIVEVLFVIVIVIAAGGLFLRHQGKQAEQERRERRLAKEAERKRLLDCEEVVRYFANFYGYLARSVVSREELAERIDAGSSAEELRGFIINRMLSMDGIELGSHSGGLPVILPNEYRDKHLYVVGKSGYGKTNFLRYLILQDLS